MKTVLFAFPLLIICIMFFSFQHDSNLNRHYLNELKYVCEEASVAGTLFIDNNSYSDGRIVFNRSESIRAIEEVIKYHLNLNDDFTPKPGSYWTDKITYKVYFYDDSNTVYPALFSDIDTGYTHVIKSPTVIVTINAGSAPYHLSFLKNDVNIRSAAHAWEGR